MPIDPRVRDYYSPNSSPFPDAPTPSPAPAAVPAPDASAFAAPTQSADTASQILARLGTRQSAFPAGLDLEGLRAAQDADRARERDMALARAGMRASALMTGRQADYTGLTPDQANVRRWVEQRQLANEERDRQIKEALLPVEIREKLAGAGSKEAKAQEEIASSHKTLADLAESERTRTSMNDAGSVESQVYRDLARKWAPDLNVSDNMTAARLKELLPQLEKDFLAEMARQSSVERARIMAAAGLGPGGGGGLSAEALAMLAAKTRETGELPNLGQGRAGAGLKIKIANEAAKGGDVDLAANKASYRADAASLQKLQTQADNIEAFEKTGRKNIQVMLDLSKKIPNLGSPALNRPLRSLAAAGGNADILAFEAARQTAATEAAKILGGALGPLSDSARHEAEVMMDKNATPEQLQAAANVLIRDFDNRRAANRETLDEIKQRGRERSGAAKQERAAVTQTDTVIVKWGDKFKMIPREKLAAALKAGAIEVK